MEKVLNFGIVGYGMIAKIHAKCIEELPGATLVAVCGRNRNHAQFFVSEYGAQVYTDYQDMLADENIHAI